MVPSHLIHHFIRGYFDGDGCITGRESEIRVMSVSLISNMPFCIGLQDILVEQGFSRTKIGEVPSKVQEGKIVGVLHYGGGCNVERFYRYLYRDATVYLKRKYDRMKRLLELRAINNARPRHNKRSRIYLNSPDNRVVEMHMDAQSLAQYPICKLSIYHLAKGIKTSVKNWTLHHVESI